MTAHTKIGGAWKDVATIHAKVGGTWKEITEGHTKISGAWKQFYTSQAVYRYWRYVEGSTVDGHHPRVARIDLKNGATLTRLITYVSDNCSDSGTYIVGTVTIDLGAGNEKWFDGASTYSSFAGGNRSANVTIQYSSDNSNWSTGFTGVMANYDYPATTGTGCGIFEIYLT